MNQSSFPTGSISSTSHNIFLACGIHTVFNNWLAAKADFLKSLNGINKLINLKDLVIDSTTLSDLSNIESLEGITAFQSLDYLDCSSNNIDNLDLSNNNLKYINCSDNQLIEIDVSNHLNLLTLKCSYNEFTQIDVSQNTSLLYFECIKNKLTSLDISSNVFLIELWCNDNNLISLDVAGIDIYVLVCDNNLLTTIDNLSDNISLKHLSCSGNNI